MFQRAVTSPLFFLRGLPPGCHPGNLFSRWARRKIAEGPGCLPAQCSFHVPARTQFPRLALTAQAARCGARDDSPGAVAVEPYNHPSMKKVVHAACPHDCPDACGVLITVEDGRATRIQGDPAHPVTRGFLCAKVAKYLDRVYSPDRVLYPMRRVKPKGPPAEPRAPAPHKVSSAFPGTRRSTKSPPTSAPIIAEFGSEAILPYSYGGTLGVLNGGSMDRRFFHRLGASQLDRTICSAAGEAGLKSVHRRQAGHRAGAVRAFALHHRLGLEHSRQQCPPVAVHRGGPPQGREAGGD